MTLDDQIDLVLAAIADGRTMEPLPVPTGSVLLECFRLGLLDNPERAVPTLTEDGHARVRRMRGD